VLRGSPANADRAATGTVQNGSVMRFAMNLHHMAKTLPFFTLRRSRWLNSLGSNTGLHTPQISCLKRLGRRSGQAIGGITVTAPVLYSVKCFPQDRYPAHRPQMGGRVDGGRSCAKRPARQTKRPNRCKMFHVKQMENKLWRIHSVFHA
jgi:hypothetical protein